MFLDIFAHSYRLCVADHNMYEKKGKYIPQNKLEILLVYIPTASENLGL